jgi:Tfp pilus assembly protein PilP
VGIAGDDRRRTAVVEDGIAKKFYALFIGTYIGPNEGRVVEILPDRVIVEERIEDPNPKVKKAQIKRSTMMLRKEEEGGP